MTRKTKIQIAVAVAGLGTLAWALWPGRDEEPLRINFVGAYYSNLNLVTFETTNTSTRIVDMVFYRQAQTNGVWERLKPASWQDFHNLEGHYARTQVVSAFPSGRWRVAVFHNRGLPDSWYGNLRLDLSRNASVFEWTRLSEWLGPGDMNDVTYGPVMLGNQPAPPSSVGAKSL